MKLTMIRILFILMQIALLVRLYAEAPNLFDIVEDGTTEAVQEALRAGANVNARTPAGGTALMMAAWCNEKPEVIRVLLAAGADIEARTEDGWTALMIAASYNMNPDVVRVLLEAGADLTARSKIGQTVLMFAAGFNENSGVVQVLLEAGADVNARNEDGMTVLMYAACYNENPEVVRVLLAVGADIDARNEIDKTVLMLAATHNENPEVIRVLLTAGADIDSRSGLGWTVLIWAAGYNENPEVVRVLLAAGADIDAWDDVGMTALMFAAGFNENPEIVLTLLNAGADAKAKNTSGKTAWDYAQNNEELKGTPAYWKLNDARFETESSGVSEMLEEFYRRVDEGRKQETDTETPTTDGKAETGIQTDSPFQLEWDESDYGRGVLHIEEVDLSKIKNIRGGLMKVRAEILIDPSGRVSSVSILESSGNTEVDTVVRMALYLWQFASVSEEKGTIKGIITYTIIGTKR